MMLCRKPYSNRQGMLFGCGQCMPCRVNKRRLWTHRVMLEASLWPHNAFLTLTYTDENLPLISSGLPTLNPKHLQDWLKRLRMAIMPSRVRYYCCGEYGDETHRPHYHVALFNYPSCLWGNTRLSKTRTTCCSACDLVQETWSLGQIYSGSLEKASAHYIAGYVTKKMTSPDDIRLEGRHPEFARMSLKPGIGADAMHEVASTLLEYNLHHTLDDVPSQLRHGKTTWPLGPYLRRKLRSYVGKDEKAPETELEKMAAILRPLREIAFNNSASFKETVVTAHTQKVLNMETKAKIYSKGKTKL